MSLPSGLVTFVMTDIEGSTRLFGQLGETYPRLLAEHRKLLRDAFGAHQGVEVDTEGDSLFVAFADAAAAVAGCFEGQRALAAHPWPPGGEVRVRMGLHTGFAEPAGGNYVALAVHQVARICAAAHGDQIVLSEATARATEGRLPPQASLAPLGFFQLRGFTTPERLFQLRHPELRENFPPLRALGVVTHNLPTLRASFVGREHERSAIAALLSTTGVVTLVGAAGVGKSRLAVQVAFDVAGDFPDGAWLVELAALTDPGLVPRAVAAAVKVAEQPGRDIEEVLVEGLASKVLLLLLDNCEHLLDAVAGLAERLSQRCPRLVVLATSREPLDIDAEVVWRVGPLSTPDPGRAGGAADVAGSEAVRLFVERARLVRPDFELDDRTARDVARVVGHLDGIPLAIELAAAALGDRSLPAVVEGLSDRFSLLTHGRRTAPERHQTMRAALEWSLNLLPEDERRLFRRLAVFAGGGTTEAVAEVCDVPPLARAGIPRLLRRLLRASLVAAHPGAAERWSMLESVRELASLELESSGESPQLAVRHREWYLRRVEEVQNLVGRQDSAGVMSELATDHDNIRRAIDTAAAAGDAPVVQRLCTAMTPFWMSHGDWSEGLGRLRSALAMPSSDKRVRLRALVAAGNLLLLTGDLAAAEANFGQALHDDAVENDDLTAARALSGAGYVNFRRSRLDDAEDSWGKALAKARSAGDLRTVAGVLRSLAIAAGSRGHQDRAGEMLDDALRAAREAGDDQVLRTVLGSAAERDLWLGRYDAAAEKYGRALNLAAAIGDLSARPLLLAEIGWVSLLRGDVAGAERLSVEAAELAEDLGNRRVLAHALRLGGEALLRRGRAADASSMLDRALAAARELDAPAEVAGVRCSQACAALEELRFEEAGRLAGEAVSLSALPHPMRRISPEWVLGVAALARGDLESAGRHFTSDLSLSRFAHAPRHEANGSWGLAGVATAAGDLAEAALRHARALQLRRDIGDRLGVADSLVGVAATAAKVDPEASARLVGAASALRTAAGATATLREAADEAAALHAAAGVLGRDRAQAARQAGEALDEEDAVAAAIELCSGVESEKTSKQQT
ncbi:MAG TPA: hypothetical protein VHL54_04995 [Actinomycetota bacterium]|nr:hypothetical protein [Actinomycetota bacterium]